MNIREQSKDYLLGLQSSEGRVKSRSGVFARLLTSVGPQSFAAIDPL